VRIFRKSNGSRVTKANIPTAAVTDPDPQLRLTDALYVEVPYVRGKDQLTPAGSQRKLLYPAGTILRTSQINALFPAETIASISPATGGVAGNTTVTITGTGLDGVTGVTFGGTAGTALTILSPTQLTVKTPAHAAGAVNVVLTAASGTITKTNGFTYA
jgi:hypothetical protein